MAIIPFRFYGNFYKRVDRLHLFAIIKENFLSVEAVMVHLSSKQNRFYGFFSWGFFFSTGFICCGKDCVFE